jgi:hypothetical protein
MSNDDNRSLKDIAYQIADGKEERRDDDVKVIMPSGRVDYWPKKVIEAIQSGPSLTEILESNSMKILKEAETTSIEHCPFCKSDHIRYSDDFTEIVCYACGGRIPIDNSPETESENIGRVMADSYIDAVNTIKDKTFESGPNRIFVFGSNYAGIHGAGAAKAAHRFYGAEWGKGEGIQGNSYAIPTKNVYLGTLSLNDISRHVDLFLEFARNYPELYFFVTRIGCGLAGYQDDQIAPMFKDAPVNCELPHGWREMNASRTNP